MGEAGFAQAGFVWGKWLAFCSIRGIAWQKASSSHVQAFTQGIFARKPAGAASASPVSLRRYWRILSDLYAHAVLTGLIEANPAVEAMPAVSEKTSSVREVIWPRPPRACGTFFAESAMQPPAPGLCLFAPIHA